MFEETGEIVSERIILLLEGCETAIAARVRMTRRCQTSDSLPDLITVAIIMRWHCRATIVTLDSMMILPGFAFGQISQLARRCINHSKYGPPIRAASRPAGI